MRWYKKEGVVVNASGGGHLAYPCTGVRIGVPKRFARVQLPLAHGLFGLEACPAQQFCVLRHIGGDEAGELVHAFDDPFNAQCGKGATFVEFVDRFIDRGTIDVIPTSQYNF